jgi:hypothetical protein
MGGAVMSDRNKKILIILSSVVAALLVLALSLWLYYRNAEFGFAREVSLEEESRRLQLIQTAEKWLGCKEEDNSHTAIIDLYNTQEVLPMGYEVQYTDSWCATFVTAAAMEAGLTDIIPPECSCEQQIKLFSETGNWIETDWYLPKPGDYIYYDWNYVTKKDSRGWSDHVGIVVKTFGPVLLVIEGNKDDDVSYRYLFLNDPTIRGFAVPDYSAHLYP